MTKKRVVVTGMGTINPCGNSVNEFWDSLKSGYSGIELINEFDVTNFPTKFAGNIKNFTATDYLDAKEAPIVNKLFCIKINSNICGFIFSCTNDLNKPK